MKDLGYEINGFRTARLRKIKIPFCDPRQCIKFVLSPRSKRHVPLQHKIDQNSQTPPAGKLYYRGMVKLLKENTSEMKQMFQFESNTIYVEVCSNIQKIMLNYFCLVCL